MCGIAGFIGLTAGAEGRSVLVKMTGAIAHRGPDDTGVFESGPVFLGHRRLSIIDVSTTGHQPMFNEDGSVAIVYNGEIFNHATLRPDLERAGHVYRSHCDTETIIHAYEQYGPACLDRFRGMFAFAIWDANTQKLFCARDRLGKKPLYYYATDKLFAFASEIKALLQHPAISAELNEQVLPEYFSIGYSNSEQTLYKGIRKLMPGHWMEVDFRSGRIAVRTSEYWQLPFASGDQQPRRDDREWIEECRQRIEETVRMRLMSDVPLGMFLSGGLDSSSIAALMTRMVDGPVKTFSVGYAEEAYSELGYAREVAEHIGTDHHEVRVSKEDFFNVLPKLIWHEDEPIVWPSSVSLYFVSKLASERVKVVLTGEGSDELFAGYGRYYFYLKNQQAMRYYGAVPSFARSGLRSFIASTSLLRGDLRRKLQHTVLGCAPDVESIYIDSFYCSFPMQGAPILRAMPGAESAYENFLRYWNRAPGSDLLGRMLYADQKTYLVELLMKQDQMSMAASIESRVPFLDHEFVEFAARVPGRLKLKDRVGKHIVKEAVADLLPASIIHRKKMGFPTPLKAWLAGPAAAQALASLDAKDGLLADYVDMKAVRELVDRHRAGLEDATDRIWRLINLQIWGEVCLRGRDVHPRQALASR
jgi:asparagine synthase (glutamine-hydrolysing)